jgi:multidrug efflux pump subunit AcrA (membrane-fusion protein)
MKTSNIIIQSTVLLLSFALLWGCTRDDSQSQKQAKPKAVLVQVVEVQPRPLQSTVEIIGTIEPKASAKMIAISDGAIEELYVRENDLVQKNQVVGVLSSADRLALLGETQARLERVKSKSGANPQSNHNEELQRATEDREYAERLFLGTPIVSPIKGRVIDKPIEVGSVVSAKQLLLTVADLSQLIIRTAVSELLLPKLKIGQKIPVHVDAYPNQQFSGTISLISPHVDPATRTGEIEVRVADAAGRLKPGMLATLTIVTERRENALAVPSDAIIVKSDGQSVVFVAQDSVAHQRMIATGLITKTQTEIRDGLHAGERVVVMGQELLKDGLPVRQAGMPVKVQQPKKDAVKTGGNAGESGR